MHVCSTHSIKHSIQLYNLTACKIMHNYSKVAFGREEERKREKERGREGEAHLSS